MKSFKGLLQLFESGQIIPEQYKKNFFHQYLDIAWFGILNGSTLYFLSVYATRLGASTQQIGFISAAPAIANMLFTLPAGRWLRSLPTTRAVFWSATLTRIFYFGLALLPFFIAPGPQIWVILVVTFILSIPGTMLAVSVNALFAQTVPMEWRGHVSGIRNALLSLISLITVLGCGQLLSRLDFPTGYQLVFLIGFLGAAMSTVHLGLIKPYEKNIPAPTAPEKSRSFNLHILQGRFGHSLLLIFIFYTTLSLALPLFPVYQVNVLHFPDNILGLGNGMFYVAYFIASTQMARVTRRHGNHKILAIGMMGMSLYPFLLPLCTRVEVYLLVSLLSGFGYAPVGVVLVNYLLERVPPDNLSPHLAWYNLAINAATLLGAVCGPLLSNWMGLLPALLLFAGFRLLSGAALFKWGK